MQNINPDQHLGKTGLYYRKKTTNEIIYNATEKLTIKLMNWVRDKFIESEEHEDNLPKTYLPDEVIKEIKEYLVLNFTSTITDLLKIDFPELFQTDTQVSSVKNRVKKPNRKEFKESQMSEVLNVSVYKPSQFPTEEYRRNFYLMLNLHLESVFMAPFFILTLAIKWQQQSISLKLETIREMQYEIER